MTRKDYDLLQVALGDALFQIRQAKRHADLNEDAEMAFWYTVETLADYLKLDNKAFDDHHMKDEVLRIAQIGDGGLDKYHPTHKEVLKYGLGLNVNI